jgi:hypothetical protein
MTEATDTSDAQTPWNSALNLYQRMLLVSNDCGAIAKDGKADSSVGGYAFVRHDDVAREVRRHLVKRGVLCLSTVEDHALEIRERQGKSPTLMTTFHVATTFINVDKPDEKETIYAYSYGLDTQDKGPGKAWSYAKKNALINALLLPIGADLEEDRVELPTKQEPRGDRVDTPKQVMGQLMCIQKMKAVVRECGMDESIVGEYWREKGFAGKKPSEIPVTQARNTAAKWARRAELWGKLDSMGNALANEDRAVPPGLDTTVLAENDKHYPFHHEPAELQALVDELQAVVGAVSGTETPIPESQEAF